MANEITANPAELRKYAEGINKCNTSYRNNLMSAKAQFDSLRMVWTGDASDAFNASFIQLLTKCNEGVETLGRMITALYESADAYERNEKAVQSEASKLPKLPNSTMRRKGILWQVIEFLTKYCGSRATKSRRPQS